MEVQLLEKVAYKNCIFKEITHYDDTIPLGALNFFFGGCVPHGFPKVGSRERIFLEKWGV